MNTRSKSGFIVALVIIIAAVLIVRSHNKGSDPVAVTSTQYRNTQYGFSVDLPQSWIGYTIVNTTWRGDAVSVNASPMATTGPQIAIRNPVWTSATPYQDIPVMIFTIDQWNRMQDEQFHIGAAPVNPSELGRNSKYVFALPARYNFAYPAGVEEVQKILDNKPLHTFEPQ